MPGPPGNLNAFREAKVSNQDQRAGFSRQLALGTRDEAAEYLDHSSGRERQLCLARLVRVGHNLADGSCATGQRDAVLITVLARDAGSSDDLQRREAGDLALILHQRLGIASLWFTEQDRG